MQKVVYYEKQEEIIGKPSLSLDGEQGGDSYSAARAAEIISNHVGVEKEKLKYFISNMGIKKVFEDPDIIGLDTKQKEKLNEIKELILAMEG